MKEKGKKYTVCASILLILSAILLFFMFWPSKTIQCWTRDYFDNIWLKDNEKWSLGLISIVTSFSSVLLVIGSMKNQASVSENQNKKHNENIREIRNYSDKIIEQNSILIQTKEILIQTAEIERGKNDIFMKKEVIEKIFYLIKSFDNYKEKIVVTDSGRRSNMELLEKAVDSNGVNIHSLELKHNEYLVMIKSILKLIDISDTLDKHDKKLMFEIFRVSFSNWELEILNKLVETDQLIEEVFNKYELKKIFN